MKSFTLTWNQCALVLLIGAIFASAILPFSAKAAAVTVSTFTATTSPAYTNTGFATTTRAKIGDTIQFQLTLSGGAPLVSPQINLFSTGSTTMTGSGVNWWYATTTTSNASVWNDGIVTFRVSVGQDTVVGNATTTVTSLTSGSNIYFDIASPTLNSVSWSDADSSTEFSAGDTLTLTFSETMATSTIVSGNVDTTLGLSGSHTFGTSPTVSWNTAGTILTLTLGTSPTLASGDTIDPTSAVKDAIGNADATVAALTITDNAAPAAPAGLSDTSYGTSVLITLSATGSTQIRYTLDGTTPSCSVGNVYSAPFPISTTVTISAIACDAANNASSVSTATYTRGGSSSGGGHHSSSSSSSSAATSASGSVQATIDALKAKIAALLAQVPGGASNASGGAVGGSDLKVGSSGAGVQALQVYLNTHGFMISSKGPGSKGYETTLFGGLTRAALAKFQASVGITPASGFFGPKTRAYIAAHP